jgi:hypothetical protein
MIVRAPTGASRGSATGACRWPFFLHRETGAPHPRTAELVEAVAQRVEKAGIEAWFALDAQRTARRRSRPVPQDERHARRLVRLRLDALERAARLASRAELAIRPISTSKAPISIAAGSRVRC